MARSLSCQLSRPPVTTNTLPKMLRGEKRKARKGVEEGEEEEGVGFTASQRAEGGEGEGEDAHQGQRRQGKRGVVCPAKGRRGAPRRPSVPDPSSSVNALPIVETLWHVTCRVKRAAAGTRRGLQAETLATIEVRLGEQRISLSTRRGEEKEGKVKGQPRQLHRS